MGKVAIWELGFRPFFLLGLAASAIFMGIWVWTLAQPQLAVAYFPPRLWHAHEMLYGFGSAIVIGFLFTASQNWTGIPGIKGIRLRLLALLWVTARVLLVIPELPHILVAVVDVSFLPLCVWFLYPYLGRKAQKHVFVLVMLAVLAIGNLLMHLGALGFTHAYEEQGLYLGVNVIMMIVALISGRVIPFFTENSVPGYVRPTSGKLDMAIVMGSAGFVVFSFFVPMSLATGVVAACVALMHLTRWSLWLNWQVWRRPILWILYVGYAWLVVGYGLTAAANLSLIALSPATHAFTAGAIGAMTIGMISRVSLGHTGRPISAARLTTLSYYLVSAAAATRVFGPVFWPEHYSLLLTISGSLWICAFIFMLVVYAPILMLPRVDGRPG